MARIKEQRTQYYCYVQMYDKDLSELLKAFNKHGVKGVWYQLEGMVPKQNLLATT